ncbi:MAG: hypothetical protein NT106_13550, partial [Candidatus Sumerlaeota bacterium]|nr:hypothetical protein [Candidatus Sumerlaeota bacterium]
MKKFMTDKLVLIFWAFAVIFYFPNLIHANDNFSFMDFSWNDNAEIVKNKMEKNNFSIEGDFETKSPNFQEVFEFDEVTSLSIYREKLKAIDAKLPSSLLFKVYDISGPADSAALSGKFCISNAINKLTFYNITINPINRDNIEGILVGKYGMPSSSNENYKLWQKGEEKLFLLLDREILYLNEEHLNRAISKMTSGIKDAKSKELLLLNKVFVAQCDNTLCLHEISWNVKEDSFQQLMKSKHYFIGNPKKITFNLFPFEGDKMLDDLEERAHPAFLIDEKVISEYSGSNKDKNIPISGVKFYFSSRTQKLLYYIVEIESDFKENIRDVLDTSIGSSKKYALGKYWNKENIYI